MARYTSELDNKNFVIRMQWIAMGIVTVFALGAMLGWMRAPENLTLHIPPDIRSGASVKAGEVPPPNVYAFAHYIWQQVNRWPENGEKDYGAAIFKMQAFITPACRELLQDDMNRKAANGELTLRTRGLQEVPNHGYEESRVKPLGNGVWKVILDTEVHETVRGIPVKNAAVRYPLRVIRFKADPEANQFGLAIDCFDKHDEPTRLNLAAEREAAKRAAMPKSRAGGVAGELQNALTQ